MKKSFLVGGLSLLLSTTTVLAGEYENCMKSIKTDYDEAACMQKENQRLIGLIQKEYNSISQNAFFRKWNANQAMVKGSNLMSQYDAWLEYRNSYCSLYTLSMSNYMNSDEYNLAKCLYDITVRQYDYVKLIIQNSNSEVPGY